MSGRYVFRDGCGLQLQHDGVALRASTNEYNDLREGGQYRPRVETGEIRFRWVAGPEISLDIVTFVPPQ